MYDFMFAPRDHLAELRAERRDRIPVPRWTQGAPAPRTNAARRIEPEKSAAATRPTSVPCIACGKTLEDAFGASGPEQNWNQPSDAVTFVAHGNYGSTVFDPFGTGEVLEINVCDDCLTAAAARGRVIYAQQTRRIIETGRASWTGPGHQTDA